MVQTCAWLEQVERAHEALDLGDRPACVAASRRPSLPLPGYRSWRMAIAVANGKTGIGDVRS